VFKETIRRSDLIGEYASSVAIAVICAEGIISFLLFFIRTRIWGLLGSVLLLLAFTAYIAYMLISSKILPCSCGGIIQKLSWPGHLVFNIIFTILAGLGVFIQYRENYKNKFSASQL
jgi:hypothetical protein